MASLTICRICGIKDVRMHYIINTYLQKIYEQLTGLEFERTDKSIPLQVCYICYVRLQNCSQLRAACLKSEELFTHRLEDNEVNPTQTQNISTFQIVQTVAITVRSCVPEASGGSENHATIESDNLEVDLSGIKDELQLKEEYVEATDNNEEDFIQFTGPGDSLDTDDVNTGEVDMLDNIKQTIKAEDYSTSDSCELVDTKLHRKLNHQNVEEITESSSFDGDHSIPTNILKDIRYKTVSVVLHRLVLDNTEPKLKLAKLEETTRGNNTNKLDTGTFKQNKIKEVQTIGQVVTEKAVVDTSSEGIHYSAVQYKYDSCNRFLKDKYNLLKQIRVCHVEKEYPCDMCDKRYNRKGDLIQHIRIHTGEKPYKCATCNKRFLNRSHLKLHLRIHTGEKPYKCDICDKRFSQKGNLLRHIRSHTDEKPYTCDTCDKRFVSKRSVILHFRIHTGEKPYKCDICDKPFRINSELLRHTRSHTGEKPYKCDTCDKRFNRNGHLVQHIRIHSSERPYQCDTCGKCFIRNDRLLEHIRIHTGERPYMCGTCDKRFKSKSDLLQHTLIHTDERPYKCDTCDKRFRRNGALLQHIRFHTAEKQYKCDACDKRFRRNIDLLRHIRTHTETLPVVGTLTGS